MLDNRTVNRTEKVGSRTNTELAARTNTELAANKPAMILAFNGHLERKVPETIGMVHGLMC